MARVNGVWTCQTCGETDPTRFNRANASGSSSLQVLCKVCQVKQSRVDAVLRDKSKRDGTYVDRRRRPGSGEAVAPVPRPLSLAKAIAAAATGSNVIQRSVVMLERDRDPAVVRAVLLRAGNNCEACFQPAPFVRADGRPYLEVHHMHRLSDGGIDHPTNAAAVCPNCHKRIHHGGDGAEHNEQLRQRIAEATLHLYSEPETANE